jgi:hypothetical protein
MSIKCSLFGCITSRYDYVTERRVWLNRCPRCNAVLDR